MIISNYILVGLIVT